MLFLDYVPELNQIELDIYNYISHNLDLVALMTIRELAEVTHVSKTTIWRFCKKFNCEGYTDFKFKLKNYIEQKKSEPSYQDVDETLLINFLQRSSDEVLESRIQEATSLLLNKEFVVFIGEGTSKLIAEYGETYFSSIFNLSLSVSHLLLNPFSKISQETSSKIGVIALSVSGTTTKVINNIKLFSELGADVISITNSDKNQVAVLSDVNIPYYISVEKNKTADITSQVPALFLIEKLAKNLTRTKNNT